MCKQGRSFSAIYEKPSGAADNMLKGHTCCLCMTKKSHCGGREENRVPSCSLSGLFPLFWTGKGLLAAWSVALRSPEVQIMAVLSHSCSCCFP